jgi:nucleotide-binding universal stress UspA family protein
MSTTPVALAQVSFRNILFATDLRPGSLLALPYAASFAQHYGAKLFLTHIIPANDYDSIQTSSKTKVNILEAAAEEGLVQALGELGHIDHEVLVDHGSVRSKLFAVAERCNIDLIIIGAHGWRGIKKLLKGSTAEEIACMATRPVLTVGPCVSVGKDFKRILYETDFSPASECATPIAFSLAETYDSALLCLHVNDWGSSEAPVMAAPKTHQFFRQQVDKYASARVAERCEFVVEFGSRAERMSSIAAARRIDLIIIGLHGSNLLKARIAAHLPGSTVYDVVSEVRCPVLTVPSR